MKHKVYIMIGPSGSGKSTWIKNNLPLNAVVCSADTFFTNERGEYHFKGNSLSAAHAACQKGYSNHIHQGWPIVVVDNTNLTNKDRKFYVRLAKQKNYEIHYIAFKCDNVGLLMDRNTKGTPQHIIERHIRRMSIPDGAEIIEVE
tara:strand:+ start:4091 stop:4525 length:435 start_codon:yes stop_codon:yes gene_type:complete